MEELREAPAIEEAAAWRSRPHLATVGRGHGGRPGRRGRSAST
jgi:hypothetical protein